MEAGTYLTSGPLYTLCLAQRLALCSVKYVGVQSVTLEMKLLKLTFHDFLRPHNSLETVAVVSSTDFNTKLIQALPLLLPSSKPQFPVL